MEASKNRMGFMKLPPELRNRIYELGLTRPAEFGPRQIHQHYKAPCILQVNRQVRAETTPIYYSQNTFGIAFNSTHEAYYPRCTTRLEKWLASLDAVGRNAIQKIVLDISSTTTLVGPCRLVEDDTATKLLIKDDHAEEVFFEEDVDEASIDRCGVPIDKWELKWQLW